MVTQCYEENQVLFYLQEAPALGKIINLVNRKVYILFLQILYCNCDIYKTLTFYLLVSLPQCTNDTNCNGGICEYQEYDNAYYCTGCPPNVTGSWCECKTLKEFHAILVYLSWGHVL